MSVGPVGATDAALELLAQRLGFTEHVTDTHVSLVVTVLDQLEVKEAIGMYPAALPVR